MYRPTSLALSPHSSHLIQCTRAAGRIQSTSSHANERINYLLSAAVVQANIVAVLLAAVFSAFNLSTKLKARQQPLSGSDMLSLVAALAVCCALLAGAADAHVLAPGIDTSKLGLLIRSSSSSPSRV